MKKLTIVGAALALGLLMTSSADAGAITLNRVGQWSLTDPAIAAYGISLWTPMSVSSAPNETNPRRDAMLGYYGFTSYARTVADITAATEPLTVNDVVTGRGLFQNPLLPETFPFSIDSLGSELFQFDPGFGGTPPTDPLSTLAHALAKREAISPYVYWTPGHDGVLAQRAYRVIR